MVKCIKCLKLLNKRSPGLQCSKCSKWNHAACVSITPDQLSALNATDSIDWKCKSCIGTTKSKRLSCILPDEEAEDITDSETRHSVFNPTQQLLHDIRQEVKEIIREELQRSLQYYTEKIEEYEEKIITYESNMKALDNQCIDLRNNIKNLNLKYDTLENKFNQLEQNNLTNHLEICGIQESDNENTEEIARAAASVLHQSPGDILKIFRKKKNQNRLKALNNKSESSVIVAILREGTRDSWIAASKKTPLTSATLGQQGTNKIYLREALSPATAFLLWKTKSELTGLFNYIWCKRGSILIRKTEKEKVIAIRSLQDLEKIKSNLKISH